MHFNLIVVSMGRSVHWISQRMIIVFATMILLQSRRQFSRYVYALVTILFILYLFTVNYERTGMVAFLICGSVFSFYVLSWRKIILLFLGTVIVLISFYAASPKLHRCIDLMILQTKGVMNYQMDGVSSDDIALKKTSIGLRYNALINSLDLIAERPWFGHGLGSARAAYLVLHDPFYQSIDMELTDPDNMYLMLLVELGGVEVYFYCGLDLCGKKP